MLRHIRLHLFSLLVLLIPISLQAADIQPLIEQIDDIFYKGMEENYQQSGMDLLKESLDLAINSLKEHPDNYDILFRCSRSASEYGETARSLQVEGWKDICRIWGKRGIDYTEKAQKIDPNRVEAYYWQSHTIGIYTYASGLVAAIKEGLYGKSKHSMDKAYEIDKSYMDYSPVYIVTMFYHRMPWPFKNHKKATQYYSEYAAHANWSWEPQVRYAYVGDFLLSTKDDALKNEGERLINLILTDPHPRKYYLDWANEMKEKKGF